MFIIHGSENDRADFRVLDTPLCINSCGTNTTLSGGHALRDTFSVVRPKGRQDYQLLYLTHGKAEHAFGGEWRTLTAGEAVLYRPGEPQHYVYRANTPVCCKWVHFSGSEAARLLEETGLLAAAPVMTLGESMEIDALFDRLIRESRRRAPCCDVLMPALLWQLLALMGRQLFILRDEAEYQTRRKLMRAAESMHVHYAQARDVATYAAECGMSRYHFTHLFRELIGQSPYAYLSGVRLARAKELLESSDMPIGRIAAMVGYENPLYFSRFFTAHCGLSPSAYRAQRRAENGV